MQRCSGPASGGLSWLSPPEGIWEAAVGRYRASFTAFGIQPQDILLRLAWKIGGSASRLVSAALPALAARDPLPDLLGQPRLPLVINPPLSLAATSRRCSPECYTGGPNFCPRGSRLFRSSCAIRVPSDMVALFRARSSAPPLCPLRDDDIPVVSKY